MARHSSKQLAEALLLAFFTPEELDRLTPSERRLLIALRRDELPDLTPEQQARARLRPEVLAEVLGILAEDDSAAGGAEQAARRSNRRRVSDMDTEQDH